MSGAIATVPRATHSATFPRAGWPILSVMVVVGLAALVRYLERGVPVWFPSVTWLQSVEYPVYAVLIGLAGGAIVNALGIRDRIGFAIRTEFFIKTGLVLLGASINLNVLVRAAGPAILQTIVLVTAVFLSAWWFGGLLRVDLKVRALLAAALSICGVSAAIAAAGAVRAGKEQLAYIVSLVVLVALPLRSHDVGGGGRPRQN